MCAMCWLACFEFQRTVQVTVAWYLMLRMLVVYSAQIYNWNAPKSLAALALIRSPPRELKTFSILQPKARSTPATMSKQHCRMLQCRMSLRHCCRFWQQSRTLLRHCCWCGRGLKGRSECYWLFPDRRFPQKTFPRRAISPKWRFRQDTSPTRCFPDMNIYPKAENAMQISMASETVVL